MTNYEFISLFVSIIALVIALWERITSFIKNRLTTKHFTCKAVLFSCVEKDYYALVFDILNYTDKAFFIARIDICIDGKTIPLQEQHDWRYTDIYETTDLRNVPVPPYGAVAVNGRMHISDREQLKAVASVYTTRKSKPLRYGFVIPQTSV